MLWNRKKIRSLSPKGIAAELWGRKAKEMASNKDWSRNLWQSHPITQKHIQMAMTGDPAKNWLMFVKDRYCPQPRAAGLSLGCGGGAAERDSISLGICRHMLGLDLSPDALDSARKLARQAGLSGAIDYSTADLDDISLPENVYDVIIAGQSVHHVSHLEKLAAELRKSITADGILIVNEYVGPSRYQWTDKTDRLMNELLHLLPREKRLMPNGTYKEAVVRPTPEQVIAVDPTESVRSEEIMPVLDQYFVTDYHANFGGTLLQFLMSEIIANFDENDPMDRCLIDVLVHYEKTLIAESVITSDFVFAVLKPRV